MKNMDKDQCNSQIDYHTHNGDDDNDDDDGCQMLNDGVEAQRMSHMKSKESNL